MGYVILWLEQLAFCWLLAATGAAFAIHIQREWLRKTLLAAVILVPAVWWCSTAVISSVAESADGFNGHRIYTGLTVPLWLLFGFVLVGGIGLVYRGCRSRLDQPPLAHGWPALWLLLASAIVLAAHVLTLWNLDLAVQQQLATLRNEASALALANSPPRVVDRENAALLYQQAFDGGVLSGKEQGEWLDDRQRPVPGLMQNEEFLAYVRHKQPLLRLVREATSRPACHFGRDWGRPSIDMLLPEIQNMRSLARSLVYEAYYLAAIDDRRGALENVLAIHRLAEHTGQEPILISLLVSFALDSMAKECLEHLLQTSPITNDELAALGDWQPISNSPRLQRAFRLEEAFGLASFCQLADDPQFADKVGLGLPSYLGLGYRVFLLPADVHSYQQLMGQWQRASFNTYVERERAAQQFDASIKTGRHGPLTMMLLPALAKVHETAARSDAQQRLVFLALAMHRHRLRHGQFPEQLDELTAKQETYVPLDPFTDKPLRMIRRDDRRVLYSVGPDQQDDAGAALDKSKRIGDVTFELFAK